MRLELNSPEQGPEKIPKFEKSLDYVLVYLVDKTAEKCNEKAVIVQRFSFFVHLRNIHVYRIDACWVGDEQKICYNSSRYSEYLENVFDE